MRQIIRSLFAIVLLAFQTILICQTENLMNENNLSKNDLRVNIQYIKDSQGLKVLLMQRFPFIKNIHISQYGEKYNKNRDHEFIVIIRNLSQEEVSTVFDYIQDIDRP